jgi:hypothetical protein
LTNAAAAGDRNFVRVAPFFVPATTTFDRIACNVTTQGTAAALVRLGVYNMAAGLPTTLELDAGDVQADTPGQKEVTISLTLQRGWYGLAANRNENAIALRRGINSLNLGMNGTSTGLIVTNPSDNMQFASAYGALPASASGVGFVVGGSYVVALRVA